MPKKLTSMKCPECGGQLELNCGKRKKIFCPYCGSQIEIDNENEYTININKNININKTKRKIDDADIIRAKNEGKGSLIEGLVIFTIIIVLLVSCLLPVLERKKNESAGKISVGSYKNFVDENYEVVVKQFENMGFENIETVDLNDSGFLNKRYDVESVSIAGNSAFFSSDYFNKTDKVLITYH